jgi:hypothetical protein
VSVPRTGPTPVALVELAMEDLVLVDEVVTVVVADAGQDPTWQL